MKFLDKFPKIIKVVNKVLTILLIYFGIGLLVALGIYLAHPNFFGDEVMLKDVCFVVVSWPIVLPLYGIAHKG